jgi:hypothetical protein
MCICERAYCTTFLTVRGQYRPQCIMHPNIVVPPCVYDVKAPRARLGGAFLPLSCIKWLFSMACADGCVGVPLSGAFCHISRGQEHFFAVPEPGKMVARINWRISKPNGDFIDRSTIQVGWGVGECPSMCENSAVHGALFIGWTGLVFFEGRSRCTSRRTILNMING